MVRFNAVGLVMISALILSLMGPAGARAEKMPDVIQMKAPYEHKKAVVTFTHQKHVSDYNISCGECHHNDQGQPLTDLKPGDKVQPCFVCHSKPGEVRGKEARLLTEKERLAYHANAMHANCVDCHKAFDKGKKDKPAPISCKQCHVKE